MSAQEKLAGAFGKIRRAEESIHNLDSEIEDYLARPTGHVLKGYRETEDADTVQVGLHGPEVPQRFSILIGEIAHQLRSSLDHLVWQLVLQANGTPNSRSEFPVFLDLADYRDKSPKKIAGVSATAGSRIEDCQPFRAFGGPPREHPLWILHELDRIDKHRLLISTKGSVTYTSRFLQDQFPLGRRRMEYPVRPPSEVDVRHYPVLSVILGEVLENSPIVPMLSRLSAATRAVMESFSGEFS